MIALPYDRTLVLRAAWAALLLGAALWYGGRHQPAAVTLGARVAVARAALAAPGPDTVDDDTARLGRLLPPAEEAPAVAAGLKDALGHLERRSGVRVTATEPLVPTAEGPLRTGGYRVSVVGRYEDVGSLLAELASLPRLTGVRDLRLHAVPDSLVRGARPYAPAGTGAAPPPSDSAGAAAALADAGEPPFHAVALFELRWYTLAPPDTAADSAAAAVLPGGAR